MAGKQPSELVDMNAQLKGLPIDVLVSAPLVAACNAQKQLAQSVASFIQDVGLQPPPKGGSGSQTARRIDFSMTRPVALADGTILQEKVDLSVPMLSIVPIPNLQVSDVTVDFEMTVHSQFSTSSSDDAASRTDFGTPDPDNNSDLPPSPFTFKIHGEVASHKDQTRASDNSARYTIHVAAKQQPPSEGLMKILDILGSACVPKSVTPIASGTTQLLGGSTARPVAPPSPSPSPSAA